MEFDRLFDIEQLKSETTIEMDKNEFYEKTHKMLNIIDNIYSKGWQNRSMQESDFPEESICDTCCGEGVFREGIGQCFQKNGDCGIRFCDYEQIGNELEAAIFNIAEFFELLSIEKLK